MGRGVEVLGLADFFVSLRLQLVGALLLAPEVFALKGQLALPRIPGRRPRGAEVEAEEPRVAAEHAFGEERGMSVLVMVLLVVVRFLFVMRMTATTLAAFSAQHVGADPPRRIPPEIAPQPGKGRPRVVAACRSPEWSVVAAEESGADLAVEIRGQDDGDLGSVVVVGAVQKGAVGERAVGEVVAMAVLLVQVGEVIALSVALFGSQAHGDAAPGSPVDLAAIVADHRARARLIQGLDQPYWRHGTGPATCGIIITPEELKREADALNALGGLIADGVIVAGDPNALDGIAMPEVTEESLSPYFARAVQDLALTTLYLPSGRRKPGWVAKAFDVGEWVLDQVRHAITERVPRFEEELIDWQERRLTRQAVNAAQYTARIVFAAASTTQPGLRLLPQRLLRSPHLEHVPERDQIEALAEAAIAPCGPPWGEIALGHQDRPDALLQRMSGALAGLNRWVNHADTLNESQGRKRLAFAAADYESWDEAETHFRTLEALARRLRDLGL